MSKANRSRRPARPAPFRDAKKRILVVCEGSTEKEYVDGFVMSLRSSLVVAVEAVGNAGVPISVVEMAKELKSSNAEQASIEKDSNVSFDSVWVIFDVDEHPRVADAKIMARDNGIGVAVSNPCIELWLYLHFAESPGMQDRHKMLRLVKEKLPSYNKHIRFADFADEAAVGILAILTGMASSMVARRNAVGSCGLRRGERGEPAVISLKSGFAVIVVTRRKAFSVLRTLNYGPSVNAMAIVPG